MVNIDEIKILSSTSIEKALTFFNEMKIKGYTDILKYAQKASLMLERTPREEFKRLILDILQNVYGNTAKLLLKLLKTEYKSIL